MTLTDTIQSIMGIILLAVATVSFFSKANKAECALRHDRIEEERSCHREDQKELKADIKDIKASLNDIQLNMARGGMCGGEGDGQ